MPKEKFTYSYLYGVKGRRKRKAPNYSSEFERNFSAASHKSAGYRVRSFKIRVPPNKPKTTVI